MMSLFIDGTLAYRCAKEGKHFLDINSCFLCVCVSPFGLLYQNTTDWVAYKQQKFIAHSSGSLRSRYQHDWVRALF